MTHDAIPVAADDGSVPHCHRQVQAMNKLAKGDRVKMTTIAIIMKLDGPYKRRVGVVTSTRLTIASGGSIRVLRDGLKTVETWSRFFWEKDQ